MKPQYFKNKGMYIDGNLWQVHPHTCEPWTTKSVMAFIKDDTMPDEGPGIVERKQAGVLAIKRHAEQQIRALDWKVQRARDRIARAELGGEAQTAALEAAERQLLDVLNEREAIRSQSNVAGVTLLSLKDAEAVAEFEQSLPF